MYRPAGPREIWTENLMANPGSFSTSKASDDWPTHAGVYEISPARVMAAQAQAADVTAYATAPTEQNWLDRFYGTLSPAKVTAGATGSTRGGSVT